MKWENVFVVVSVHANVFFFVFFFVSAQAGTKGTKIHLWSVIKSCLVAHCWKSNIWLVHPVQRLEAVEGIVSFHFRIYLLAVSRKNVAWSLPPQIESAEPVSWHHDIGSHITRAWWSLFHCTCTRVRIRMELHYMSFDVLVSGDTSSRRTPWLLPYMWQHYYYYYRHCHRWNVGFLWFQNYVLSPVFYEITAVKTKHTHTYTHKNANCKLQICNKNVNGMLFCPAKWEWIWDKNISFLWQSIQATSHEGVKLA